MIVDWTPALRAHAAVAVRAHIRRLQRDGIIPPAALAELADALLSGQERPEVEFGCRCADARDRAKAPVLLGAEQAASRLGVSPRTLRRLAASGAITQVRTGRRVGYHQDDIAAYIAAARTTRRAAV